MNTIIAAAIAIALAFGYGVWSWNKIDSLQEKNAALTLENEQAKKQKKIDDETILELDRKKAEIQVVKEQVIKEVVRYEKSPNAGKCILPADFVRIHDMSISRASGGANETVKVPAPAEQINDIDVLGRSTSNNASAISNITQCEGLMDWVNRVRGKKAGSKN